MRSLLPRSVRTFWKCVVVLVALSASGASAQGDGEDAGVTIETFRPANGLGTDELAFNALLDNPASVNALRNQPLQTASLSDGASDQTLNVNLHEPHAQAVMAYLIKCALKQDQTVEWKDPFSVTLDGGMRERTWKGELGLCPEWHDKSPESMGDAGESCLNLVSACLLARNNPEHKKVPLALRLDGAMTASQDEFPDPTAKIRTIAHARFATSEEPLQSFNPECAPGSAECGWRQGFVGACRPGEAVQFTLSGPAVNAPADVRVCNGIYGCDGGTSAVCQPSIASPNTYFFNCGDGNFSLMTKQDSEAISVASPGIYPARPHDVFHYREGAFFGTLFGGASVTIGVNRETGDVFTKDDAGAGRAPIFKEMYACFDEGWADLASDSGVAYQSGRLCTLPGGRCVANPLGACSAVCGGDNGKGAFASCKKGGALYPSITTFLNAPCDLVGPGINCKRRQEALPLSGSTAGACGFASLTWLLVVMGVIVLLAVLLRKGNSGDNAPHP